MSFSFPSFLTCFSMYLVSINLSQANPMKGINVRDATSSDHLSFVVSIGRGRHPESHFCTGTLITRQSVLTSEHCLMNEDIRRVRIIIGSTDLRLGEKYRIAGWTSFTDWYYRTPDIEVTSDDIAIITLKKRVNDINIRPATIRYIGYPYHLGYSQLQIAGWGFIDDDNTLPMILKTGLVKLISLPECIRRGEISTGDETFHIPRHYFCSSAEPWILAHCGDSGGPTLNENNEIVAITKGACPNRLYFDGTPDDVRDSNLMNVHLNLMRYRNFIEAVSIK